MSQIHERKKTNSLLSWWFCWLRNYFIVILLRWIIYTYDKLLIYYCDIMAETSLSYPDPDWPGAAGSPQTGCGPSTGHSTGQSSLGHMSCRAPEHSGYLHWTRTASIAPSWSVIMITLFHLMKNWRNDAFIHKCKWILDCSGERGIWFHFIKAGLNWQSYGLFPSRPT